MITEPHGWTARADDVRLTVDWNYALVLLISVFHWLIWLMSSRGPSGKTWIGFVLTFSWRCFDGQSWFLVVSFAAWSVCSFRDAGCCRWRRLDARRFCGFISTTRNWFLTHFCTLLNNKQFYQTNRLRTRSLR